MLAFALRLKRFSRRYFGKRSGDYGNNNVTLAPGVDEKLKLTFGGGKNTLQVDAPHSIGRLSVHLADGASVRIEAGCILRDLAIHAIQGSQLTIGRGCGFNDYVVINLHERRAVRIGADCLIAGGTHITISDMHSVVDVHTGERLNPAADIVIGDHVWLAQGALVLKGSVIGEGSIIGANSTVTGAIPKHALAVGSPARVVKENVTWKLELI